jgi:hypothetical protein
MQAIVPRRFKAVQTSDASSWYVLVALPRGLTRRVNGFETEQKAKDWIARDAAAWLKRTEGGKYS